MFVTGSDKIKEIVESNRNSIMEDTLADKLSFDGMDGFVKEWDLNGEPATFGVKQL